MHNPHEPEAQWAAKGVGSHRKEHVGYKIQVAETVSDTSLQRGEPTRNFLTSVLTLARQRSSDEAGHRAVEEAQAQEGRLDPPPVWYVDGSYVSAELLAQARAPRPGANRPGPTRAPQARPL